MTVHFIGAGPGAADLITVRGRELIRRCPVVIYAGSLVPETLIAEAATDAQTDNPRVIDSAPLTLDEIVAFMADAHGKGEDVARVHSGDPSLYGAIGEQMRRLDALSIPYDITPGVPSFAAAAAALGRELTLPQVCQTVILTRTAVRTSPMPRGEDLATLGRSGATLVLHLSVNNLARVVKELTPLYGGDCPAAVVWRASWPDELVLRGTLSTIRGLVRGAGITRTALIIIGRVLGEEDFSESRLYAPGHAPRPSGPRPRKTRKRRH